MTPKHIVVDLSIVIIVVILGFSVGIINGVEEPLWVGRKSASFGILTSSILFFGIRIFYLRKENNPHLVTITLFFITVLFSLKLGFTTTKFNSKKWKSSINWNHLYGDSPSHNCGRMVEDIVLNKIMLGKNQAEIIEALGESYFTEHHSGINLWYYFYKGGILDGCDKLWLQFENNICVRSGVAGCD